MESRDNLEISQAKPTHTVCLSNYYPTWGFFQAQLKGAVWGHFLQKYWGIRYQDWIGLSLQADICSVTGSELREIKNQLPTHKVDCKINLGVGNSPSFLQQRRNLKDLVVLTFAVLTLLCVFSHHNSIISYIFNHILSFLAFSLFFPFSYPFLLFNYKYI
jgi:hypothetical protein